MNEIDSVLGDWGSRKPLEPPSVHVTDRVMQSIAVEPYSLASDRWAIGTLGALASIAACAMLTAWPMWSNVSDPTVELLINMIGAFKS
jgi:hypothetical protein